MYIDILDDIVSKCNNTYHSRIKMKPVNVKSSTYIGSSKEINDRDPKFKIGDIVRISKYKSFFFFFFEKGYAPNWPEEVFVLKKVKNTVPWTYVISELKNDDEIFGTFTKKNCKKQIKKSLKFKK